MKNIIFSFFLLLIISATSSIAQKTSNSNFTYSGAQWEKYNGHKLTIAVLDTIAGGSRVVVDQIISNGKFKVSGEVKYPQNAFFGLYNPNDDYVYKQEFILEPGNLNIDLDKETNNIIVAGGKYNPLFNSFVKDPEYLAKQKAFNEYTSSLKQEDFKKDEVKKKYTELQRDPAKFLFAKYNEVRFNNTDPVAQLLAIYHSDRSIKYDEQLNELENKIGSLPEIVYLRYSLKQASERRNNSVNIKIGSIIKDFKANNLKGKEFHLANVLQENKYTLVEFWASWCGPCRAEIPHMKKAYEAFNKKGFQIVSFSLDHDNAKWTKASNDENLPWIDIGDLLAYKSPVVKMFGINGIPANYLVDPSGVIIAMNLRQDKLDEKLAELLGKP